MRKMFCPKWWVPILAVSLLILVACGANDPDLAQAADVIRYMMKPQSLSRSVFYVAFPDGKPSQFVAFSFPR